MEREKVTSKRECIHIASLPNFSHLRATRAITFFSNFLSFREARNDSTLYRRPRRWPFNIAAGVYIAIRASIDVIWPADHAAHRRFTYSVRYIRATLSIEELKATWGGWQVHEYGVNGEPRERGKQRNSRVAVRVDCSQLAKRIQAIQLASIRSTLAAKRANQTLKLSLGQSA